MCRCFTRLAIVVCILMASWATEVPAFAQFGGGRSDEQVIVEEIAEAEPGDESKSLIAITVWILTLAEQAEPTSDELSANLAERAANLPPIIGSIDEARELIGRMQAADLVRKMRAIRLLAIDGQKVSAEVAVNMPRVVATAQSEGRRMNNIRIEPTGTIVRVVPRIDDKRKIQVSVTYEASNMEKSSDVAVMEGPEEEAMYADVTATQKLETTVSVRSGDAVLLHSDALLGADGTDGNELKLIILGAEVVGASD
jgi:hypothetical protein